MKKSILPLLFILLTVGINSSFAQTALPYSINFGQSQEGWSAIDNSTKPGTTWTYHPTYAQIQGVKYGSVMLAPDYSCECNDYYISPAFSLEKDKSYTIELCVFEDNSGCEQVLSLEVGTSNTDVTSFIKLKGLEVPDNSEYPAAQKLPIGVPSSGIYYFAFHSTSPSINNRTYILEFKLYEGDDSGETPEDVIVNPPYSVDLRTDYKDWTVVDNNNDGKTWTPMNGFGPILGMALSQQHDDYFLSPMVTLKKGQVYKITTNVVIEGTPKGHDIVTLTQGIDKEHMTPLKQLDLKNNGENIQENYFTPQNDGKYYFSFHNTSTGGGNPVYIYSFAIEEFNEEIPEEKEIFSTNFSGSNPLEGWKIIDTNNDKVSWELINGYNGPVYDGNNASSSADDWLITPSINMIAGKDYLIKFTMTQAGAFEADTYEVRYGNSQSEAGMTEKLISDTINFSSGNVDKIVRMTCTNSQNTHIGFRLTTPVPNGIISLDKVSVFETGKAKPKIVEDLSGEPNFLKKNVTLKWKNPAFDISNALITDNLDINIYENGIKVKTLENRKPGLKESFVYSPANYGGIVSYQVCASINGIESLPSEVTVNLDDIQGEDILLQNFPLDNNSDFEKWKIENLNGGASWEYSAWDKFIYMKKNNAENNNDWAITAGVELEPGKRYVISFDVSTSVNYPGNLKVMLGNSQTNSGMTKELLFLENICYNGFVRTITPQFSVETAGTYYIGFQAGKAENGMNLKNVNIRYIKPDDGTVSVFDVPYEQMFDENTETPEGWKIIRSNNQNGFFVLNVKENAPLLGMEAPSGPNALIAKNGSPAGRKELVYTPKFAFKAGKTYDISFMLQMFQQDMNNILTVYKATGQSEDAIVGEALLETNENTMFDWIEKKMTLSVTEDIEYTFVIKVTNDQDNGGAVMIDNFNVVESKNVEPIDPVNPAPVKNLKGLNNGGNRITLTWEQPTFDIDGKDIQEDAVIKTKVYDGNEFIGETETIMPNPASVEQNVIPMTFQYTYSDINKFAGQKIFKCVPYMEDKEGPETSTILTISSFTKGYLKEPVYSFDFKEDLNRWTASDADEDGNTWKNENAMAVTDGCDEWLISPETYLNPEKSYYVTCQFDTDTDKSVNITFTRGNDASSKAQNEVLGKYENVMVGNMAVFEIGGTFNPEKESTYFGIHVESKNGTKVKVKSFAIMRLFTMDEPEELPYEESFENPLEINEATNFTNKWGRRTSTSQLFNVTKLSGTPISAHSGEYALVANEFDLRGRDEVLFTPYFTLKANETYEISFFLYMPGNGDNITTGQVVVAYTQDDAGIPLPVILNITEPVKEWTKFNVRYTAEYDMDHCLYFAFNSTAANSGMIAFDDFKIEKVDGSSISETGNNNMYYENKSSILYLPENIVSVSLFNMQGQIVMKAENICNEIQISNIERGIYVVRGTTTKGEAIYLKINKE